MTKNYKFKVGDIVVCTHTQSGVVKGKTYVVKKLYDAAGDLDAFWTIRDDG